MRIIALLLTLLLFSSITIVDLHAQTSGDYERALKLYKDKRFSDAAEILQRYIQEKPTPSAYYLLGYALYKMGKHSEAMKYFKEAYLLDPDFKPESIKFK
ncbi:MAG: tetratricopeptide repeat protein [Nitrospirae bacterium]|nr:tetratricopeptide repeat protein [Nitrospirota bacterium]